MCSVKKIYFKIPWRLAYCNIYLLIVKKRKTSIAREIIEPIVKEITETVLKKNEALTLKSISLYKSTMQYHIEEMAVNVEQILIARKKRFAIQLYRFK